MYAFEHKNRSIKDLIYFPVIYNLVGLVSVFLLFAFSPEHAVEQQTLNMFLYLCVFIIHWSFFFILARRIGTEEIKGLITPKKKFRWLPSIILFISLNVFFTTYMIAALIYGRIQPWSNVDILQSIFYIVLNPITAGFVEEVIWRGNLAQRALLSLGKSEWKAVIYSSLSFDFISLY